MTLPARSVAQTPVDADDVEAALFMQKCFHCHQGVLTGRELLNTSARPVESLEATVRRMQQYAGALTEEQISQLVSLMHDESFVFRLEEAKLDSESESAVIAKESGAQADEWGRLFVQSCAACHTVGGGTSSGGDLTKTSTWTTPTLQAAVSSMQARVGPLTDVQINGLVALLKDSNRMTRLKAAGYKQQAAATPSAAPQAPQIQSTPAPAAAHASEVHGETQQLPVGLLAGILIFTVIVGIAGYFLIVRNDKL